MKIKLVSDLHLEFSDVDITNTHGYDVLILGGDILIAEHLTKSGDSILGVRFRNFLQRCSDAFPHVIYIAGNHELYRGKWISSIQTIRDHCESYPNVYFLECDTKKIDDITFVGATLWTDMNKEDPLSLRQCNSVMMDYSLIRHDGLGHIRLRPMHTVERHRKTLDFIKNSVEGKDQEKFVVVGHHAPSHLSIHARYRGDFQVNGAYYSDLSEFILTYPQIKLWTHGHTHTAFDYMIGDTRIVCNPRGYEGHEPDSGWSQDIIIEV